MSRKSNRRNIVRMAKRVNKGGMFLAGALTSGLYVDKVIFGQGKVENGCMEPRLSEGDRVLADRRAFNKVRPERGDLILYRTANVDGTVHDGVKRIIAFPGERVEIKDGIVFVDGRELDEPYRPYLSYDEGIGEALDEAPPRAAEAFGGGTGDLTGDMSEFMVPDDCVFVLGDDRTPLSYADNRSGRVVRWADVVGKVLFRFWPPAKAGAVR